MSLGNLLDRLDPQPDIRGRQFEHICAWYLRNAPEYKTKLSQVWLWKDWPGAWAADAGIDLVAEDHDGGLWAIQAKAYDEAYAIKKADVDSFLSESSRPGFTYTGRPALRLGAAAGGCARAGRKGRRPWRRSGGPQDRRRRPGRCAPRRSPLSSVARNRGQLH
jgi:hypothetical protein